MTSNLSDQQLVDLCGKLRAARVEAEKEEKAMRDMLIARLGVGAHEGELFRASVSLSERETLDMAAVREKLSPQFIRAHTTVTEVTTVRLSARKGV